MCPSNDYFSAEMSEKCAKDLVLFRDDSLAWRELSSSC